MPGTGMNGAMERFTPQLSGHQVLDNDCVPETTPLSEREKEVLRLLCVGKRDNGIGVLLGISEATVRQHVAHALRKLRAKTRPQAIAIVLTTGQLNL